MLRTMTNVRFLAGALIAAAVAGLLAALVLVSPSASGVGPAGGGPTPTPTITPVDDLTGIYCADVWLDLTDPPPIKGDPHEMGDALATKIISRVEASASQPGDWDITSVAYSGPGGLIPDGPPSDEDCKTKEDDNELVTAPTPVPLQPVSNDRPTAIGTLVQKGAQQNLEYVICQQEDLPGLGEVWVRSEFAIVVDGLSGTQDFGVLTAYVDVTAPNDPQDPLDTSCGDVGALEFFVVLEVTQRVATKDEPQPGVPDDWDGDGCSDWDELGTVGAAGGLRDPMNNYDLFDTNGDARVDLPNDILGVILHWTPSGAPYDVTYDRGPSIGPNPWNKDRPDGTIDLPNDILGVILQWTHEC